LSGGHGGTNGGQNHAELIVVTGGWFGMNEEVKCIFVGRVGANNYVQGQYMGHGLWVKDSLHLCNFMVKV